MKKDQAIVSQMMKLKETLTFQEIGDKYGITRQRVYQLIGRKKTNIVKKRKKHLVHTPEQKLLAVLGSFLGRANIRKNGKNRDKKGMFIKKS